MFTYFESISPATHPPLASPTIHPLAQPPARSPVHPPATARPFAIMPTPQYNPQISLKAFQSIHFTQAMWYSFSPTGQTACSGTAGRPPPANPTY